MLTYTYTTVIRGKLYRDVKNKIIPTKRLN